MPRPDWFVLASSQQLGPRPLATELFGARVVLYRDPGGAPIAAEDRCPHRNASLSRGRVQGGELQCPYHGWRFGRDGALCHVPSAPADSALPEVALTRYACAEADGSVFVSPGGTPAHPPRWPAPDGGGYRHFELATQVRCPMVWVINNFVDAAHTGVLHRGLFRSEPSRQVEANIRETPTGVRIETTGEGDTTSLLSRLLLSKGDRIAHSDELILPSAVRVDYRFGARRVVSVSMCTPLDEQRTLIHTRVYLQLGLATAALLPVLKRVTQRIIAQDLAVLEDQAEQLRRYGGPRFVSTDADGPCIWVTRALHEYAQGRFPPAGPRAAKVTYRL